LDSIVRASSGVVTTGPISTTSGKKNQNSGTNKKKHMKMKRGGMNDLVMTHEAATSGAAATVTVSTTKPDGSARFVNYSQEKFTFPDGRRGMRFYVIDEAGTPTLAVLGEERETRDGHYQYKRVDTFTAGAPLRCGNLSGVHKWLKDHISGGQLVGVNFPFSSAAQGQDKSSAASAAALARRKRGDIADGVSLIDPAVTFQTKIEEREAQWALARRNALAYVREPTHPDHIAELKAIVPVLKAAKAENKATVKDLLAVIEAFRALNSVYVSLHTLDSMDIKDVVVGLQKHPNETISQLATKSVQQWIGSLYSHIGTLASVYERPKPLPPRNKVGYGPANDEANNKGQDNPSSPLSLRHRTEMPTPTVSGAKRDADEALPASSTPRSPPAKMQKTNPRSPECTPIGKGHKLCPQCSGTCGSPSRVCPHCGTTLPYKSPPKDKKVAKV
jgi:hypothetical protein